jgi:hypothetical protein
MPQNGGVWPGQGWLARRGAVGGAGRGALRASGQRVRCGRTAYGVAVLKAVVVLKASVVLNLVAQNQNFSCMIVHRARGMRTRLYIYIYFRY